LVVELGKTRRRERASSSSARWVGEERAKGARVSEAKRRVEERLVVVGLELVEEEEGVDWEGLERRSS